MATAVEGGLNRHWSRSSVDVASGRLSAASCQDENKQPCDFLLNLGWQSEAAGPTNSTFCDNDSSLKGVLDLQYRADGSRASSVTVNSCGDANFLLGLFKAVNDNQEFTSKINSPQYSSVSASKLTAVNSDFACLRYSPGMHRPGWHNSHDQLPVVDTTASMKRLRRRQCHSESELSPVVAFGNGSLSDSVTHFFSFLTLGSCIDTAGSKKATFFTVATDALPENDASPDPIEPDIPGREVHAESPDPCQEFVQSIPSVAGEQITPIETHGLTVNDTPDSSFDKPLTLSRECLDFLSSQQDSEANCSTRETSNSPDCSVSNQSSTKLAKSVSFADDIGKSLTEVFEFDSTAENFHDYHADIYGDRLDRTLCRVLRKSKIEERFYSGRFTRSRVRQRTYDYFTEHRRELGRCSEHEKATRSDPQVPINVWNITFPQPAAKYYEFRQKVENNAVSLESISVVNPEDTLVNQRLPDLSGTVKVLNLSYHKQVWLRISVDNWQTFTEHQATYSQLLSGGHLQTSTRFDTFTFQVSSSALLEPFVSSEQMEKACKIEFAIRYTVEEGNKQYWDNNEGKNYIIERYHEMSNPTTETRSNLTSKRTQHSSPSYRHDSHASYCFSDYNTTTEEVSDPYTSEFLPNFSGITSFTDYRVWNHFVGETVYY